MPKCECGKRDLQPGEKLCPACAANRAHGWKRVVEVGGGVIFVVGLVAKPVWKIIKSVRG